MTLEEFTTIISSEVERLEEQKKELSNKVQFLEKIGGDSKEIAAAKYELSVTTQKLDRIRTLVGMEAVARIQTMSEIELEAYRNDNVQHHELSITRAKNDLASKEAAKQAASKELEELMKKGDLSEEAISKGKMIRSQIIYIDQEIADLKNNLDNLVNELAEIKNWTLDQIREDLMPKQVVDNDIDKLIRYDEDKIGVAKIGEDFVKATQLANLRTRSLRLDSDLRHAGILRRYNIYRLPKSVQSVLSDRFGERQDGYAWDISVSDPKQLIELLNKARMAFDRKKRIFEEEYTLENLEPLVEKNNINDIPYDVDFAYLEKYEEIIGEDKLEELRNLVKERDLLSRKLIKTKTVKSDIASLIVDIRMLQFEMYGKIIGYYNTKFDFGYFKGDYTYMDGLDLSSKERLIASLEKISRAIKQFEQEYDNIQSNALTHQKELEEKKKQISEEKENVEKEMIELTGSQPRYFSSGENQLERVANETSQGYRAELLQTVKDEAQKQSDTREAELRNVTLDQLYEMRKKLVDPEKEESEEIEHNPMRM